MIFKKADQWLRDYWSFYDTHGTRILGGLQQWFSGISAAAVFWFEPNGKTAALLLGINALFGGMTGARGKSNATNLDKVQ